MNGIRAWTSWTLPGRLLSRALGSAQSRLWRLGFLGIGQGGSGLHTGSRICNRRATGYGQMEIEESFASGARGATVLCGRRADRWRAWLLCQGPWCHE